MIEEKQHYKLMMQINFWKKQRIFLNKFKQVFFVFFFTLWKQLNYEIISHFSVQLKKRQRLHIQRNLLHFEEVKLHKQIDLFHNQNSFF